MVFNASVTSAINVVSSRLFPGKSNLVMDQAAADPDQPDGSAIALPPDLELRADLCAQTGKLAARWITSKAKTTFAIGSYARLAKAMLSSWLGRRATTHKG